MMQRRWFRSALPGPLAAATALLAAVLPAQAQTGAGNTDAGLGVYTTNCVACHQAGGTGIAGAFLTGTKNFD